MLGRKYFNLGHVVVLCSGVMACASEPTFSVPPGRVCDPMRLGVEPEGPSFQSDQPLCVGLELPPNDFKELSNSSRFGPSDIFDKVLLHLTTDCTSPYPEQFPWFEADLVSGGETTTRVGLRKKGFLGSVVAEGLLKPSFKIKTDRYVDGQLLGNVERVTLNNSAQDQTRMHDCMAYGVFAAAGYPAPQCNLANVMVNATPLGAYVHVEPLKKRFLTRAFGNNEGSFYEGAIAGFSEDYLTQAANGNLGRWQAKTDETDPQGGPLLSVVEALRAGDDTLLEKLDEVIDLERFYLFWALEALIDHADGYTGNRNNFYIYFDPANNNRGVFVPWGADAVLRDGNTGDPTAFPRDLSTYTFAELPRRLSRIPQAVRSFEAQLQALLDTVWNEEVLLNAVQQYAEQVKLAQDDPNYDDTIEVLRNWIGNRRQKVEGFLDRGLPQGVGAPTSCFTIGLDGGFQLIHQASEVLDAFALTW